MDTVNTTPVWKNIVNDNDEGEHGVFPLRGQIGHNTFSQKKERNKLPPMSSA